MVSEEDKSSTLKDMWKMVDTTVYRLSGLGPRDHSNCSYPAFRRANGLDSFKYRLLIWLLDQLQMRRQLYQHLKARGIPVIFWVCNTYEDYKKVFDIGAQGVMTDYPTRLRAFLQSHRSNTSLYDGTQLTDSTVRKSIGQRRNRRRSGRCFIKNSLTSHLTGDYTFLKPANVVSH
ncbi:hypothetical protein EG68_05440 [Paragonimus skrjabini miyazakii]|uniref:GP-PDE domain-containing protein n=1 Tax=Paragonimus skrjabini miyazakii TaxID=59628 RepID=A0A8S9YVN5_9TREM|nr:hypothetical protein EG68_05440 [Paragonimus skrjabini miyazakii]